MSIMRYSFVHWAALLTAVRNSPCSCPFSVSLHPPQAALNSEPRQWGLMWEFVLYQNAPRPGSWQAEGLTEGEQLAALGSSELFLFRLLITFAATFPVNGGSLWVCDTMCQFSVSLHRPQDALSCCPVASQLGDSWPGKIENNRMANKHPPA